MMGCAVVMAGIGFGFGLVGSMFVTGISFPERLMLAGMPAVFAFLAALLLACRDRFRHAKIRRQVREHLLEEKPVDNSDFVAAFPNLESDLILQTRQAISEFFDVPIATIHPSVDLRNDLAWESLSPGLMVFVTQRVFSSFRFTSQYLAIETEEQNSLGDLCEELRRILQAERTSCTPDNQQGSSNP